MLREFGSWELLIGVRLCQNIAAFYYKFLTYKIVNMSTRDTILMHY